MDEMQDKQYLALELTKLKHQSITREMNRSDIMADYWYFLEDLTGVFEQVARVEELEKENERMRIQLTKQEETSHIGKLHSIISIINDCKGDMEPYVYDTLMQIINI